MFLFDEPLSNLDARLRLEARTFLKQLQRELATTPIFVTHDQSEALALADRMAVMESGVIRQVGTPGELFHRPANVFVAGFIGSTPMNLIPGVVTSDGVDVGGSVLPLDGPSRRGRQRGHLRHPSRVRRHRRRRARSAGPCRSPRTSARTSSSPSTSAACTLKATMQEGSEPQPGDTVALAPTTRRVLLYDRESTEIAAHEDHDRRATRDDDRAESIYQYLPVEVPASAAAVVITVDYDRTETIARPRPDRARPVPRLVGLGARGRRRHRGVGDAGLPSRHGRRRRGRSFSASTASRPAAST